MNNAIYAGSFNPLTNGHLGIIKKATEIFDKLYIVVAVNPNKTSDFLWPEQRAMAISWTMFENRIYNTETICHEGLIADLAQQLNVHYLVRGLRPLGDFENEYNMAMINHDIHPSHNLETIFLLADPQTSHMSSTLVRELLKFNTDVSKYVSVSTFDILKQNGYLKHVKDN
jgi:pantetheine-phosphate adenylyltransferase